MKVIELVRAEGQAAQGVKKACSGRACQPDDIFAAQRVNIFFGSRLVK
ncbi:hypothetical protein [uncultured Gilvimarinus sp.]